MGADLSVYLSSAVIATFPPNISVKEAAEYRMLQAIALVESGANPAAIGDGGNARGAWQMHRAAWIDSNRYRKLRGLAHYSWSRWPEVEAQRESALGYIWLLQERFASDGVDNPDPKSLYLAYSMGYIGYKRAAGNEPVSKLEAAARVDNIFRLGQ